MGRQTVRTSHNNDVYRNLNDPDQTGVVGKMVLPRPLDAHMNTTIMDEGLKHKIETTWFSDSSSDWKWGCVTRVSIPAAKMGEVEFWVAPQAWLVL